MTENYSYKIPSTYQVWKEYKRTVYKSLRNFGVPRDLMDDYYQESYFILDSLLKAYNPKKSKLKTWLCNFLPQRLSNLYWETKSLMRYPRYKQSTKGEGMPVVVSIDGETENIDIDRSYIAGKEDYACYNTVENIYDFNVVKKILDRAMRRIPEDYQIILKRFYGIGCKRESLKEIAASYNVSERYVGDRVIRARRKIERILRSMYKDKNIGELLDYEA